MMLLSYEFLKQLLGREDAPLEPPEVGGFILDDKWMTLAYWVPPRIFIEEANKFKRVSVGRQGCVWGLGKTGDVYKWTGFEWKHIPNIQLSYISVGDDFAVCGVDLQGDLYGWNPWLSRFQKCIGNVPNKMLKISVGNSFNVWAISVQNEIYKINWNSNTNQIECILTSKKSIPSSFSSSPSTCSSLLAMDLSVGSDGTVFVIEKDTKKVFEFHHQNNSWSEIQSDQPMDRITVGSKDNIWSINPEKKLFKYIPKKSIPTGTTDARWEPYNQNQTMELVSAGADGTVLSVPVNSNHDLNS